jgi:tRNA (guanosine-2'-O-)-methyltransferase
MISVRRHKKIADTLKQRQSELTIVLENIHDPHNVSAIFRTADAVGIPLIHLVYTNEQFPKIGKKSSSSANKWISKRTYQSIQECYDVLRCDGFSIFATHLDDRSQPLYNVDFTGKIAVVLGNEHRGVSTEAAAQANGSLKIPMMGMIQSLNVSVAAAVILYEALRQRMERGLYDTCRLSRDQLDKLISEWIKK